MICPSQRTSGAESRSTHSHEAATGAAKEKTNASSSFFDQLASRLQGDFDNYNQVLEDRIQNKLPGETGGHEHMHGTFMPIHLPAKIQQSLWNQDGEQSQKNGGADVRNIIAAYYLDGLPRRLFRLRLYSMRQEEDSIEQENPLVRMKLFTAGKPITEILQTMLGRPVEWESAVLRVLKSDDEARHFYELQGCDVLWTPSPDPKRHVYLFTEGSDETASQRRTPMPVENAFHAILINEEGAILQSTVNPGVSIRVKDELSLWENELWINDRGFNVETNAYMYGNQLGVPYKVARVTDLRKSSFATSLAIASDQHRYVRNIVDEDLAWTLGESWRTEELYKKKLDALSVSNITSG